MGCAYYKADQLALLGGIISELETNVKRFQTKLNYDDVRHNLAEALAILWDAETEQKPTVIEFSPKTATPTRQRKGLGYSIASALAGILTSSATAIMNLAVKGA